MREAPTIFVSVPVSSLSAEHNASQFGRRLSELLSSIRQGFPEAEIYCAAEEIMRTGKYSTPRDATKKDLEALEQAKLILFLYPIAVPTSALIELGYAIAQHKKIVCVTPSVKTLPFIAQSLHELLPNYHLVEADIFDETSAPLVLSSLRNALD